MGRPPSNGGPSFRFNAAEVAEMEAILQEHKNQMPTREALTEIAEKFSSTAERSGKFVVQMKQVWNWFQNRRYAIRAKGIRVPGLLNAAPLPRQDSTVVRNIPQPHPMVVPPSTAPSVLKSVPDNSQMEFEAKSARDGAWYDVAMFISHRSVETGDPDVLIRFSGFGIEEDEWVNVRKHVRQRSLPCESSECVSVIPGDLILCFQEGKEQALYYDAHVLDSQRRRHDVRGCRCRFLVRYDHDLSEEIVPLRKICRRPETDYRLQQLNARNDLAPGQQLKSSTSNAGNHENLSVPAEDLHKQTAQVVEQAVTTMPSLPSQGSNHLTVVESITVSPAAGNMGISIVTSTCATAVAIDNQLTIPPSVNATAMTSDIKVTVPSPINVKASDIQATIPPPANANVNVMECENEATVVSPSENANVNVMESENEVTVVPPLKNASVNVMETDNEVTVVPPPENANVDVMETDNDMTVVPPQENANVSVMESENEVTVVPPLENANVDVMECDNEVIVVPTPDNTNATAVVSDDNEIAVVPPPDNSATTAVASDGNEVTLIPPQDNAANATAVVSDDNEVAVVPPPDNVVNATAVASGYNEVTVVPPLDNAANATAVSSDDNVPPPDNTSNPYAVANDDNEVTVPTLDNANMDVMENVNEVTGTPPDNVANVTVMGSDNEVPLLALDDTKVALMESDNEVTVTPPDNSSAAASDSEVTVGHPANDAANGSAMAVPLLTNKSVGGSDSEVTIPSPLVKTPAETIVCPGNAPTPTNVEVLNAASVVTSDGSVIVQFTKDADIHSGTPLISQTAIRDVDSVTAELSNVAADAPALPSVANAVPETSTTQTTTSLDVENFTTGNEDGVTTAGDLVLENVDVVMEDT